VCVFIEANECSSTMICAMNAIFNDLLVSSKQHSIFPFLHNQLQDDWELESRSISTRIPFIEDSPVLMSQFLSHENSQHQSEFGSLNIQLGDFVSVYGSHFDRRSQFAAVVTCFFIDTGKDIHEYIRTIRHVLQPDGLWINLGPLHYHNKEAIPYSFNHLLDIISISGFELLDNQKINASYCGEDYYSMKPEVYRVPFTVFRMQTDLPKPGVESLSSNTSFHGTNYFLR
jgi:carnosine N-methyltransferase